MSGINIEDAKFIVKFISDASKKGSNAVDEAKDEIDEIDKKLHEAESLKIRRMKLLLVLNHFYDDSYKRRRASSVPSVSSEDIEFEVNSKLRDDIIRVVKNKCPISMRNLISSVGGYDKDYLIIRAIKTLAEEGIVTRNDDSCIIPGEKLQ